MKKTEAYLAKSRERLGDIMKTKIKTTMIGAIDTIETRMGFLWDDVDDESIPSPEEMREIFEEVRKEILDKGNHQIRNVDAELNQHEICWKRYSMHFMLDPYKGDK